MKGFLICLIFSLLVIAQTKEAKLPAYISISIWVGDVFITKTSSLSMWAPGESIFYDVMANAAVRDPDNYSFDATEDFPAHPGHFVTSIGGLEMNITSNHYWMLYVSERKFDTNHRPTDEMLSPVGVDFIKVKPNQHFLWWYKYVQPW